MSLLWTADDMIDAIGGRPVGHLPRGVTGVSIDSRTLAAGEAFFAIAGDRFDGHDFATAAMAAGAGLLVVSEAKLPALGRLSTPMIVVADVLDSLRRLAAAARRRTQARVIAVTGSVGKTTTKEMLRHVLRRSGKVHASERSFNNHWGVPLTLARMPLDSQFGVFEIGMNHAGEIRPLAKLVQPHVGIVTQIAPAHLGNFKGLEEIARAKAELFEGIAPGGHVLLNLDDPSSRLLARLARNAGVEHVVGFGTDERAAFRLVDCELHADGSIIRVGLGARETIIRISMAGRHIVQNALAVLGAAHLVGADAAQVAASLGDLEAQSGRGRRHVLAHPDGPICLIDESYNANPASMEAAIRLLGSARVEGHGRRIAVLGDMLELGSHADGLHARLAEVLEQTNIDLVLLAGQHMSALAQSMPPHITCTHRPDVNELAPILLQCVRPGDTVMIKSSNGIGFSKLVDALVNHFPAAETGSPTA